MMAELLKYLSRGGMTLAEIAQEIGIEREELHERIHVLERSGFLEEFSTSSKDCETRCAGCPIAATCHDDDSNPRYLILTEKGRKFLKRSQ